MDIEAVESVRTVYFSDPGTVEIRRSELREPGPEELLIETECSAVSSGTELLVYRGEVPGGLPADLTISALDGRIDYPLAYGYALVGKVAAAGGELSTDWVGRRVFAFHPHATHAVVPASEVMVVPDGSPPEEAVLFPSMETAVNFVQDGAPTVGERVLVVGQGVVGLLTTAVLARFPLERLVTLDYLALRRSMSEAFGASKAVDPADGDGAVRAALGSNAGEGVDLSYELSGNPRAIDTALEMTGYAGRVILGSWYGTKRADLDLGGAFHRSRIELKSSQVSTIEPSLRGRWTKDRRSSLAWRLLQTVQPASSLITHRFPVDRAAEAYRMLDSRPEAAVQVVFEYR